MLTGNSVVKGAFIHDSVVATQIAVGNTAQRPATANAGAIRYNTTTRKYEGFSDPTFSGTLTWVAITNDTLQVSGSGLNLTSANSVLTLSVATGLQNLSNLATDGLVSKSGSTYSTIAAGTGILINSTTISTNLVGGTGITVSGATISANYVGGSGISVVGNTISLSSPVSIALGGTGANTATAARTNLGAAGSFRTSFTATTGGLLTVTHNLNQQYVSLVVIDNNNRMIIPDEVTFTSATVATVDLTSYTITGTWQVVVVG